MGARDSQVFQTVRDCRPALLVCKLGGGAVGAVIAPEAYTRGRTGCQYDNR